MNVFHCLTFWIDILNKGTNTDSIVIHYRISRSIYQYNHHQRVEQYLVS